MGTLTESNISRNINWIICYLFIILTVACSEKKTVNEELGEEVPLKMNQIQVLGSHNSYKQAIEPVLMQYLVQQDSSLLSLDYKHLSLSRQLDMGLRKLEIDVLHDSEGGKFAKPLGLSLIQNSGGKPLPFDTLGKMNKPGFKVLHVQDIDFRSHCLCLTDCLEELKEWSEAHPTHLPIAISFNAKTSNIDRPGFTKLLPFTKGAYDSLDQEILSVLTKARIITPDDVRGDFTTLEEAVLNNNWPTLVEAKGKFLFVLDEGVEKQQPYLQEHASLKERVMFVNAAPGNPEAGFIILNNPIAHQDSIQQLVRKGYIVRTRADADTKEARLGDYTRFEAALTSGAQFISTDYYVVDDRLGTNYQINMPNDVIARCNPVNALNCDDKGLETIGKLASEN
jgi:hypothetical protein